MKQPTGTEANHDLMTQSRLSDTDLWEFVPIEEYEIPATPAQGVASDVWHKFKRLFGQEEDAMTAPLQKERVLQGLSEVQLAHLVPPLRWDSACEALDRALGKRIIADSQRSGVQYVVTTPYVNRVEMLRQWAKKNDAQVLEAPCVETILNGDFEALGWPNSKRWVIPELEKYFLRHANGLELIRELLNRANSSSSSRGLIGCDSWAWSYLKRTCRTPLSGALTLQAFDAKRLERLFCRVAQVRDGERICFINARNENNIITVPEMERDSQVELAHLAAHCRGNVATAMTYWRESLRATEQPPEENVSDVDDEAADEPRQIWVSSLLPEVELPSGKNEEAMLLLHCLLLHAGLSKPSLALALPMPAHRVDALVERMHQMGLLQCQGDVWYVQALAYAAVRELLRSFYYLVDDF